MDGAGQLINHRCAQATSRWIVWQGNDPEDLNSTLLNPLTLPYIALQINIRRGFIVFSKSSDRMIAKDTEITVTYDRRYVDCLYPGSKCPNPNYSVSSASAHLKPASSKYTRSNNSWPIVPNGRV